MGNVKKDRFPALWEIKSPNEMLELKARLWVCRAVRVPGSKVG